MKTGALALVVLACAAVDLAVKTWARAALEPYGPARDFLPFVSLRLTFNEGISFGLLMLEGTSGKFLLVALTSMLTAGLTVWAFRARDKWERIAFSLIVAGALANLVDRALFGMVTDYLALHIGSWHPFVFNLADVWISAGVCLLVAIQFLGLRPAETTV